MCHYQRTGNSVSEELSLAKVRLGGLAIALKKNGLPVTLLPEYENRSGPRMRARGVVRPTLVCSRRRKNHSGKAFPSCSFRANFR